MKRVNSYCVILLALTALPAAVFARQSPPAQTSDTAVRDNRIGHLADALVHAESDEEFELLLARGGGLVNEALVDELIWRGRHVRDGDESYRQEALAHFRAAEKIAERIRDEWGKVDAVWYIGYLHLQREDSDAAISQARQALSMAQWSKFEDKEAESLRLLGDAYLQRGDDADGLKSLREGLAVAERIQYHHSAAWSADSLAWFYRGQGNGSEAVRYYRKAVQAFELIGDEEDITSERYNLADTYYQMTNYRDALKLYEAIAPALERRTDEEAEEAQAALLIRIYDCQSQLRDMVNNTKTSGLITKKIESLHARGKTAAALRTAIMRTLVQGNMLYQSLANYPSALEAYGSALKWAGQIHDDNLSRQASKGLGDVYLAQGNLALARESYERSLALGPDDAGARASALLQIGDAYNDEWKFEEALKYYRESLEEADEADDDLLKADVHSSMAGSYILQGDAQRALDELRESEGLYERAGRRHQAIIAHGRSGMVSLWASDFRSAVRVLKEALEQAREEHDEEAVAVVYLWLANMAGMQGDDNAAIAYLQESLRAYTAVQNMAGMANARFELGTRYLNQGRLSEAIKVALEGMDALRETQDVANRIRMHIFLGQVLTRQGNFDKALASFKEGNELASKENVTEMTAVMQMYIAGVYYSQGKNTEALEALGKTDAVLAKVNNPLLNGAVRMMAGFIYQALGRDEEALRAVSDSIEVMEKARLNVAGMEQEQTLFFAQAANVYRTMVQLQVKRGDVPQALFWADRSKARVLLDVMQRGAVDLAAAMSPQERARKVALESRVAAANLQLSQGDQRGQQQGIGASLYANQEAAREQLRDFLNNFYLAHPELRRRSGDVPPMRVEETAAMLNDTNGALLEYVVTDEEIFLFVLTRGSGDAPLAWKVYKVERPDDLQSKVRGFRAEVSGGDVGFRSKARELYDLLLKPAQEQLRGKTSLVIVPDSVLWSVPFQALLTPANHYLLEDCAVSYAPSLATLREMRLIRDGRRASPRPQAKARPVLLALGNPAGATPPLPETEEEVGRLRDIYGVGRSEVLLRADATEERFKAEAGRYRVLHLATHGLFDDSNPMYSRIVLSRPTAPDGPARVHAPESDGLLDAREVMDLKLNADLVVLSACESAQGGISDGEGLIGLTWAFFAAGAPATVAGQWKVNSQSTTELMQSFHEALGSGAVDTDSRPGTAEALRRAAIKLMRQERYRHPYYWAGFVVVGDGR